MRAEVLLKMEHLGGGVQIDKLDIGGVVTLSMTCTSVCALDHFQIFRQTKGFSH